MKPRFYMLFVIPSLIALVLSACSSAATLAPTQASVEPTAAQAEPTAVPAAAASGSMLPEVDPAAAGGNIIIAGSSTVYPLAERIAERFKDEGFSGEITVDSIGSGAGFERFCKTGEIDISNASRAIKDSEVENCKAINRTPIEFRIGTDALAVVVSQENDFLTNVTMEELAKIFSSDVTKWSEVNPAWPDEDILRFSPGTDSGTFDFFVEFVMGPANKNIDGKADLDLGEAAILAANNLQLSEDDNVLVQGVLGSPYAIGFFGYAYYQENADKLNVLSIDSVAPTAETAESGEYPLARPLFIYSTAQIMQEKPQVAAFIYFYLTNVNNEILDVGYFPASQEAMVAAQNAWYEAVGMQP